MPLQELLRGSRGSCTPHPCFLTLRGRTVPSWDNNLPQDWEAQPRSHLVYLCHAPCCCPPHIPGMPSPGVHAHARAVHEGPQQRAVWKSIRQVLTLKKLVLFLSQKSPCAGMCRSCCHGIPLPSNTSRAHWRFWRSRSRLEVSVWAAHGAHGEAGSPSFPAARAQLLLQTSIALHRVL